MISVVVTDTVVLINIIYTRQSFLYKFDSGLQQILEDKCIHVL